MRLSRLVLLLAFALSLSAHASETPAEHAANVYAQQELDAAPVHGNIPDYTLSPTDLAKSQHLGTIRVTLHFVNEIWGIVSLVLLLALGAMAWMQRKSSPFGQNRILQAIVYPYTLAIFVGLVALIPNLLIFLFAPTKAKLALIALVLIGSAIVVWKFRKQLRAATYRWVEGYVFLIQFLISSFLLSLPLDLYSQHLSRQYGLSVQSWAGWFGDQGKGLLLSWIIGGLLLMLLFWIIRKFPRSWWLVFWGISIPLILLAIFITPYVIDPLFNKFEPLQKTNPELVARLEQVVEKGHMNIPPERMYLMKASEKVSTMNAYVTGFGNSKRVVVWDTSLQKGTPDEVLFIFGHESGHYVLNHIVIGIIFSILGILVSLFLGYHFVQWAIRAFGTRWGIASQNDWAAVAVLLLAFSLFSLVGEPIQNAFSRMDEHAADVYGQEAIHGLVANPQATAMGAFDVLGSTSFADPNPNQFYEFWTYSHPAVGRRAAFAKAYDPWAPGMEPKYFKK